MIEMVPLSLGTMHVSGHKQDHDEIMRDHDAMLRQRIVMPEMSAEYFRGAHE